MTLGNVRELGVQRLLVSCLNQACGREVVFHESSYSGDMEVRSLARRMKCGKCFGRDVDVRPNWKEQPTRESLTDKQWKQR